MAVEQPRSTTAELVLNDVKLQLRRQVLESPQAPFTTQKSTLRGPNVDPPKDGFKAEVKVELGKDGKPLNPTTAQKSLNAKNAVEFQKLFEADAPKDVQAQLKDLKWGVDNIKDPKKLVEFVKEAVAEAQAVEASPTTVAPESPTKAEERPTLKEGKQLKGSKEAERSEQRRLVQKDEVTRTNVKASDLLRTASHLSDPKKLSEAAQKRFTFEQPGKGAALSKDAGSIGLGAQGRAGQGLKGGAVGQGAKLSQTEQALHRTLKGIKDPEKFAHFAEKAMGLDKEKGVPQGTVLSKELQRELLKLEVKQEKKEQKLTKTPHPLDVAFGGKDGSALTPTQFFAAALNVYSQNPPRFRAYMAAFFAQHFANYGQSVATVTQGGSQGSTKGQTGGSFKQGQSGAGRGR